MLFANEKISYKIQCSTAQQENKVNDYVLIINMKIKQSNFNLRIQTLDKLLLIKINKNYNKNDTHATFL